MLTNSKNKNLKLEDALQNFLIQYRVSPHLLWVSWWEPRIFGILSRLGSSRSLEEHTTGYWNHPEESLDETDPNVSEAHDGNTTN